MTPVLGSPNSLLPSALPSNTSPHLKSITGTWTLTSAPVDDWQGPGVGPALHWPVRLEGLIQPSQRHPEGPTEKRGGRLTPAQPVQGGPAQDLARVSPSGAHSEATSSTLVEMKMSSGERTPGCFLTQPLTLSTPMSVCLSSAYLVIGHEQSTG